MKMCHQDVILAQVPRTMLTARLRLVSPQALIILHENVRPLNVLFVIGYCSNIIIAFVNLHCVVHLRARKRGEAYKNPKRPNGKSMGLTKKSKKSF